MSVHLFLVGVIKRMNGNGMKSTTATYQDLALVLFFLVGFCMLEFLRSMSENWTGNALSEGRKVQHNSA